LISDALPFGGLWYGEPKAVRNAVDYAKFCSRSHDAVIRVYGAAGNVIETHEHKGGKQRRAEVWVVDHRPPTVRFCKYAIFSHALVRAAIFTISAGQQGSS